MGCKELRSICIASNTNRSECLYLRVCGCAKTLGCIFACFERLEWRWKWLAIIPVRIPRFRRKQLYFNVWWQLEDVVDYGRQERTNYRADDNVCAGMLIGVEVWCCSRNVMGWFHRESRCICNTLVSTKGPNNNMWDGAFSSILSGYCRRATASWVANPCPKLKCELIRLGETVITDLALEA